ncbi:MAG: hypothetical protein M3273_08075 [Actinomycetota bacterium]|nr:hypothetical protein [Actinomycetota bacterium]
MKLKVFPTLVTAAFLCASLAHHPAAAATAEPSFVRGVYGRDATPSGLGTIAATGFNAVTVQPWRDHLDALQAQGMKGLVWLFGYNNETCSFDRDDAWIRQIVSDLAGHPGVLAYQVADEPNVRQCPDSPRQIAERARLVKSLDPSKPTYLVVAAWDGREGFPYQHYADTTDIMGLDVYPCAHALPTCKYADIDSAIAEAHKDGVDRFWAIVQDFGDAWYRTPTAAELEGQFDRWATSGMEGYFVYHWEAGDIGSKPAHLAVLAEQNARSFGATAPAPAPAVPAPATPVPATPAPASPAPAPVAPVAPDTAPAPLPSQPAEGVAPVAPAAPAGEDRTAPTPPRSLLAIPTQDGTDLLWNAATDDRGVTGYGIWRDGRWMGRTTSPAFHDTTRLRSSHVYEVRAFDAAGNRSAPARLEVTSWRRKDTRSSWMCLARFLRRPAC